MTYDQWLNEPYENPQRYDFSSGFPVFRGCCDDEFSELDKYDMEVDEILLLRRKEK